MFTSCCFDPSLSLSATVSLRSSFSSPCIPPLCSSASCKSHPPALFPLALLSLILAILSSSFDPIPIRPPIPPSSPKLMQMPCQVLDESVWLSNRFDCQIITTQPLLCTLSKTFPVRKQGHECIPTAPNKKSVEVLQLKLYGIKNMLI